MSLGDRMKAYYEDRYRVLLPRRTNFMIRVDGKAFHSFTKDLKRPFDIEFMNDMDETARFMCQNIQGAKFAFVQSDEISILLTDYDDLRTEAWFNGNLQKMASISASMATAKFNQLRLSRYCRGDYLDNAWENIDRQTLAMFDSRIFVIPEMAEVHNNFIWRQQDATRNSIQMAGQSHFSHKELQGLSCDQIQEKLFQERGINWNDYPVGFKRGRAVVKRFIQSDNINSEAGYRSEWFIDKEPPIFTQNRDYLVSHTQKPWLKEEFSEKTKEE